MSEQKFELKPYLKELIEIETDLQVLNTQKEMLISALSHSIIGEAKDLRFISSKLARVEKEFEHGWLQDIPVLDLINAYQDLVIHYKEEIALYHKSWLVLANEINIISEQKTKIVPVAISKTTEEKKSFKKDNAKYVTALCNQLKRVKADQRNGIIDVFLDKKAEDETERVFLLEMIAECENKMMKKDDEDENEEIDDGEGEDNI